MDCLILQEMTRNLELCQKSLNEYLDMKKKIFPRFYFVSNVALLDMLSNSNNPMKILPYLGDCYDSIKMLTMEPAAKEGDLPNTATHMIAKDGEVQRAARQFRRFRIVQDVTGACCWWWWCCCCLQRMVRLCNSRSRLSLPARWNTG